MIELFSRRRVVGPAALAASIFALALGPGRLRAEEPHLVVHEWGTMTTIAGDDGKPIGWSPFEVIDPLPDFVHRNGQKSNPCTVRLETPVIFFYSHDGPAQVSVGVRFPKGELTEWYPEAKLGDGFKALDWPAVQLRGAKIDPFLGDNRYFRACGVLEADPLTVTVADPKAAGGQRVEAERFLFYRGIGTFDLPVRARYDDGKIAVAAPADARIGVALVIDTRFGHARVAAELLAAGQSQLKIPAPVADHPELPPEKVVSNWLEKAGLTEKEAAAMVATWKDYWLQDRGLRILYILPRKDADEILPLTINPVPDKLERVIVCRIEIFTPSMRDELLAEVAKVDVESAPARKALLAKWRYSRVMLEAILRHPPDAATAEKIKKLDPNAATAAYIQELQDQARRASTQPAEPNSSGNTPP